MKIRNLAISKQLNIGLGVIILMVLILGVISVFNGNALWKNTQDLYQHPMTVQNAAGMMEEDILKIRLEMKELVLRLDENNVVKNEQNLLERRIAIELLQEHLDQQFDVLVAQYLGPKSDIDELLNSVIQWEAIREETFRMLLHGELERVADRTQFDGEGGVQAQKVLDDIEIIHDFASNKAKQFYDNAQIHKKLNLMYLIIAIGVIFIISMGIVSYLRVTIIIPLKELTSITEDFEQGNLDIRCSYQSKNEFGILSNTFNYMAKTVQREFRNKDNLAKISETISKHIGLDQFCQELLKVLLQSTDSQIGAIYLLNEQKTQYNHFSSIGLKNGDQGQATFSAINLEGEFGTVLATRQIQLIKDIPVDTQFVFTAVSMAYKPKEILTIPVLDGSVIVAIISLASIKSYSEDGIRLVNESLAEITARINGVLAFKRIKEYSNKIQQANSELEAQKKELVMQADELAEQNIELEMQKKMLDEASQLKSSFLSNMSHELRTPLNSVIALTSVLNRRLRGGIPAEEHSYLEVIERNGKNLLSLVNDILDIARIEAGKEEVNMSRFAIKELINELVEMITPQANEKNIEILNLVSGELPSVSSDQSMCRHILQNIISNAVKFTEKGSVEISVSLVEGDFHIRIKDTGIGINADHLQIIFDEFRQSDETTSKKYGGTGLGLAIAKKYAQLLHGSISVTSLLGEGSEFIFVLPNADDDKHLRYSALAACSLEEVKKTNRFVPINQQDKIILLVEDSEPATIQMKDILDEQGYQVFIARDGKQALEKLKEISPDAIILDLMMPEVDGFQVLEAIRGVEATALTPVLILTAKHVTKEELSFLKGNHIFQLIQKGAIGKKELLESVSNMVYKKSEEQAPLEINYGRAKVTFRPLILVVEDNNDNIITVRALLTETCDIIEARDGRTGLEQAKLHNPSLILLDISLPIMDGFQVLTELKNEEALRDIPVVALTARAMTKDREEILSYGFDGYISKPINEKLLEDTIRGILNAE